MQAIAGVRCSWASGLFTPIIKYQHPNVAIPRKGLIDCYERLMHVLVHECNAVLKVSSQNGCRGCTEEQASGKVYQARLKRVSHRRDRQQPHSRQGSECWMYCLYRSTLRGCCLIRNLDGLLSDVVAVKLTKRSILPTTMILIIPVPYDGHERTWAVERPLPLLMLGAVQP